MKLPAAWTPTLCSLWVALVDICALIIRSVDRRRVYTVGQLELLQNPSHAESDLILFKRVPLTLLLVHILVARYKSRNSLSFSLCDFDNEPGRFAEGREALGGGMQSKPLL